MIFQDFFRKEIVYYVVLICMPGQTTSCAEENSKENKTINMAEPTNPILRKATLGAGCFWCIEAIFENLKGVETVEAGYTGGSTKNPNYKEVSTGNSGHAEVAQITYNPEIISYLELLEVFWKTHDPTTLNRQGNDKGTQYRSVIFYHNEQQRIEAVKSKEEMDNSGYYENAIVTEISPLGAYYKAESYHQDYFKYNPDQPYCTYVIQPKVEKFKKQFKEKVKSE